MPDILDSNILFYSTNLRAEEVNVRDAILKGLAEDKGLYMPNTIPSLSREELERMKEKEYFEVAFTILRKFLQGHVADDTLLRMCKDAYNFPVPIEQLDDSVYIMRLDRGPTAAFKDFAARAMARLMQHFLHQDDRESLILTATSGDTGSAVANAFHGIDNIKLVVLFPEKEVTEQQRKLMTTLGGNITAIAVDAKFDDCQSLVKDAFVDDELRPLNLSSANSINFARLMPQIVYYVYAYSRLGGPINFSVPSGNFGNLMSGLFAKRMGVPISKFIVAVNENDEFVQFFRTGEYRKIEPSVNCLSNAMNVGHPSNLARLVALYGGVMDEQGALSGQPDMAAIRRDMAACSVTDEETKSEIRSVYERHGVIIEPHGAVGIAAYEKYRADTNDDIPTVCIETAHPAKFPEVIREVISVNPPMPESMKAAMSRDERFNRLACDYQAFKLLLLKRFRSLDR